MDDNNSGSEGNRGSLSSAVKSDEKTVDRGRREVDAHNDKCHNGKKEVREAANHLAHIVEEISAPMFLILGRLDDVVSKGKLGNLFAAASIAIGCLLLWRVERLLESVADEARVMRQVALDQQRAANSLTSLAENSATVISQLQLVKEQTEGGQDVVLLPETDPEKAKHAPLKVRVSTPTSATSVAGSGASKATIEIPITAEAAKDLAAYGAVPTLDASTASPDKAE